MLFLLQVGTRSDSNPTPLLQAAVHGFWCPSTSNVFPFAAGATQPGGRQPSSVLPLELRSPASRRWAGACVLDPAAEEARSPQTILHLPETLCRRPLTTLCRLCCAVWPCRIAMCSPHASHAAIMRELGRPLAFPGAVLSPPSRCTQLLPGDNGVAGAHRTALTVHAHRGLLCRP